jgi:excisionase family DNA binding protein
VELLTAAIRTAAADVGVACPLGGPPLRWGGQLDLRPLSDHADGDERSAGRVARYVAKYATKATEHLAGAALDRPIRNRWQLEELDAPEHVRRLAAACWLLGGRADLAGLRLRHRAYLLGFGGHTVTKSRRYSTSFAALRAARRAWTARRFHGGAVPLDQDGRRCHPQGWSGWRAGSTRAAATAPPLTPGSPGRWPKPPARPAASPGRRCGPVPLERASDKELSRLLTVEEAAERLNTSPRFVRRLVFERRIAFLKLGRHVRITEHDLDTYVRNCRVNDL